MDVEVIRRFYADIVVSSRASNRSRLVAAFSAVPRERYVGPGPWQVSIGKGVYVSTPSDDLAFLYQDQIVALVPGACLNSGSPSSHAQWLSALAPQPGEEIVHIGAGTGYFTAILAFLVGGSGAVLAYEIERDLAAKAARNLSHLRNVRVEAVSPIATQIPSCDAVYVNASVTTVPDDWLDSLRPGGRLMVPLTPLDGFGGMLLLTRRTTKEKFDARFVSGASFIGCVGGSDGDESTKLKAAFDGGGQDLVRSLRRTAHPDSTCWYSSTKWWLSTAAADDD